MYYDHFFVSVDAFTDLDPMELETLRGAVVERAPEIYMEVGVGHLGTLCSVARAVREHELDCHCVGIDAFGRLPRDSEGENSHRGDVIRLESAIGHLEEAGLADLCSLHQGDSGEVLKWLLPSLSGRSKLVFIDANHTYAGCLADYRAVEPWLEAGDLLIFHDTVPRQHPDYGRGPRGVIEDHLLEHPEFRLLEMPPGDAALERGHSTLALFECVRSRRTTFETAGFTVVRGMIADGQVGELLDDYQALLDGRLAVPPIGGAPPKPGGMVQLAYPSRHVKSWGVHAFRRRALAIATELLGEPMRYHEDQIIYKPPGYPGETPWHQDCAYYEGEGVGFYRAVVCWLALSPAFPENGGPQYLSGSHRSGLADHHDASAKSDVPEALEAVIEGAAAAPRLAPGDALFHHCRTLHYTSGNSTTVPRKAIVTHFWPVVE